MMPVNIIEGSFAICSLMKQCMLFTGMSVYLASSSLTLSGIQIRVRSVHQPAYRRHIVTSFWITRFYAHKKQDVACVLD
jgi:hypothetical protein